MPTATARQDSGNDRGGCAVLPLSPVGGAAAAASSHPDASRRELARLAGTSDGTVRRMETDGVIRKNGVGWEVNG